MLTEANILEMRLRMEALICVREGMVAGNAQCMHMCRPMSYTPEDFLNLENRFDALADIIVQLTQR